MPDILIRDRTFQIALIQALRCADEGGKRPVIESLGKRIVGVQGQVIAPALINLKGRAMIRCVAAVIGVVEQAGVVVGCPRCTVISRQVICRPDPRYSGPRLGLVCERR